MKAYIQYLDYDLKNVLHEACGDRAVVVLDGRNNLKTMIADGHKFNGYRRKVYPHFRIMKGNLRKATCVYATDKFD